MPYTLCCRLVDVASISSTNAWRSKSFQFVAAVYFNISLVHMLSYLFNMLHTSIAMLGWRPPHQCQVERIYINTVAMALCGLQNMLWHQVLSKTNTYPYLLNLGQYHCNVYAKLSNNMYSQTNVCLSSYAVGSVSSYHIFHVITTAYVILI